MIIEKFTNLFRKKEEESMQERAEKSRITEELEDAKGEFTKTVRNLHQVLGEVKNKEGHG